MIGSSLGRQSLPMLLAQRMGKDISEGVWTDTLPGYRTISAHYQVSEGTSKQAIKKLEKRGVLEPPQQGKKRQISKKAHHSVQINHLLIITDSAMPMDKADEQLLHDMSTYWLQRRKASGKVHRVSGDLGRYQRPAQLLKQWVSQHSATQIVFFNPSAPWIQAVIDLGLPCYYLGGELGNEKIQNNVFPGSSQSWNLTLQNILQRLKKLGHQQLLFPFDYGKRAFQESVQNTLYDMYEGELTRAECEASVPLFQESSPESWQRFWGKEFIQRMPTCVIASSTFAMQSLYVFCARNNIQIGKDLSLICIQSDDIIDWYFPRPTYLEYPYNESLHDFKSWVRNGFPQREHTFVKLIWNEGQTLATRPT